MPYLDTSNDEVQKAVTPAGWEDEDFFHDFPEDRFEKLLDKLEKQSRSIINGQLMGETLEKETDRVDVYEAPDKEKIQLAYPVQEVKNVEIRVGHNPDGSPSWEELQQNKWRNTEQFLVYNGRINHTLRGRTGSRTRNRHRRFTDSASWADRCTQVKVTYDRGFEEIPDTALQVQEELIRRMLTHLRQEQNLARVNPQEVSQLVQGRRLLTEDMKNRLGKITQARNKYVMLG